MPKLPSVTGREAVKAFERLGFNLDRITSSHHILKRPGHRFHLSVPIHGSKPLRAGTLRGLIRDAGITVEQFNAALE